MKFILTKRQRVFNSIKGLFIQSFYYKGQEVFVKFCEVKNKKYYIHEYQKKIYYNIYEINFSFVEKNR